LTDERVEAGLPAVPQIDIEDHDARDQASGNGDVGIRPAGAPVTDSGFIGGGIFEAMRGTGMFSGICTGRVPTVTVPMQDSMHREDRQATLFIS
jgi:hypothetical protein